MRRMIILTVGVLLMPVSGASAQNVRTVALAGTPAPGMPNAGSFDSFLNRPVINSAGQVAFRAHSIEGEGIWAERAGSSLALVARSGGLAPGTGGLTFHGLLDPLLDGAGRALFLGDLNGASSSTDTGIWGEG